MKRADTRSIDLDPRGWRGVAWRAYEHAPRSADALIRLGTLSLLPCVHRRVPLSIVRGAVGSGGSGTVVVAGAPGSSEYLVRRFFVGEPEWELLGHVPSWRLARELERFRGSVDLVIARLDRLSATFLRRSTCVTVPEWVGALIPIPDDPRRFAAANGSLHNNMARVRRAGFQPLVSHDERDFHEFFDRMYVPFIRNRHGPEAVLSNRSRMRRCFRQGGMLWVLRDGVRVAGILFRTRGRTLDLVVVGTENGDWGPIRTGAGFALDLFALEHAKQLGCELVDFGGSRPSPRDGLLQYKARWGARVVENRSTAYDLCLDWCRLGEPLLSFLARTPLVFRETDGLSALWAIAGDVATIRADLTAGHNVLRSLRRLYLLGVPPDDALDLGLETIVIDPARRPGWRPDRRGQRQA